MSDKDVALYLSLGLGRFLGEYKLWPYFEAGAEKGYGRHVH